MASTKKDNELKLDIPMEGVKTKLQVARVMLQKENLTKTGKNDFAHFDFFQLEDFLPSVNEIFAKLGLYSEFSISPVTIDYEETVLKDAEGTQKVIVRKPIIKEMATLDIYDVQKENDMASYEMEVAPVQIGNNTKQNIYQAAGGRNTYYKRYLYMNALEIVEKDESDTVLGQKDANYQQPTMTPYNFMPQQPAQPLMQSAPINPNLGQNSPMTAQPVDNNVYATTDMGVPMGAPEINSQVAETIEQATANVINEQETLSTESKMEIMNLVNQKGLNGASVIADFCRKNGLQGTNDLLELHKQALIDMINGTTNEI